ncbi:MAG: glycosyltransferase family 4 protein [Anaerolineaceae bacterium]|nr:glycosyltransferase family 4 protein [Anaerolineaceae bacterium]
MYAENSFFRGKNWKKQHKLILSYHQPPSFLANLFERNEKKNILTRPEKNDIVVVLSKSLIEEYKKLIPNNEIVSIPHGVDIDFFYPSKCPKLNQRILTVGNWLRDYDIWGQVVKQILVVRKDIVFDVIANPATLNKLIAIKDKYPKNVNFLSNLSDTELCKYYQLATILFLPLKDSVANNALLEGMACGLPIVITNLPATREYAGEAALFINNQSPDFYADSLLSLLDNQSLMEKMSTKARSKALLYSWELIGNQFKNLYSTQL